MKNARLVFLELELKRACKRLPYVIAGAIVLICFMGTVALLADRTLYGEQAVGRIPVGVVLPEEDPLAKQVVSMLGSLDSVESLCDFLYMDEAEARREMESGELFAVLLVPKGFVEGIMEGSNLPVQVLLPEGGGIQSGIFKELTQAGARTLGSAQAGIYAGEQLLEEYGRLEGIRQLEEDLNRSYLQYSLSREDYFQTVRVSATKDVDTLAFYGISGGVLVLLLSAVPASGYLAPYGLGMRRKLRLLGIGDRTVFCARVLGLFALELAVGTLLCAGAVLAGWMPVSAGTAGGILLVCFGAAAVSGAVFEAAGDLTGGVLMFFGAVAAAHFGAGGFLPLVFLPEAVRRAAPFLPSYILMDGVKMMVTGQREALAAGRLALLGAAGILAGLAAGGWRRWKEAKIR